MQKYMKEFFGYHDILIMSVFLFSGWVYTLMNFLDWRVWIALIVGSLLFALSEYTTHRFLFHLKPPKNPFFLKMLKRLHYDHHEEPDNLKLLFLPVWYSGPQFILIGVICYLITGNVEITVAFLTGAISYHMYYEWKHYVAHRPIRPITAWGKMLKKYHLLHHFKNENYWFGVTNPIVDQCFQTFPADEKQVETSPTARKLTEKGKENGIA